MKKYGNDFRLKEDLQNIFTFKRKIADIKKTFLIKHFLFY